MSFKIHFKIFTVSFYCQLILIILLFAKSLSTTIADDKTGNGDVQSILTDLRRISSSLRDIEKISDKLIQFLQNNATSYNSLSAKIQRFKKNGFTCTAGIGWHKLHLTNLTWNEARKSCRKYDAHLAILNSETEAQVLKSLLLQNYQFSAYIGIHNQFKEDEWLTVFGDPITGTGYNQWSVGPPKMLEANCGVLFEDGKLLGIPCHVQRSYFCEIPEITTC